MSRTSISSLAGEESIFKLEDIRFQLGGEPIQEVLRMLDNSGIRYEADNNQLYTLKVHVEKPHETHLHGRSVEILIKAFDEGGRVFSLTRYPATVDSFYDSCIDAVNGLRENPLKSPLS